MIKAVRFLSAAVGKAQHAGVFKEESTLRALVEKIVVPNIVVRDTGMCVCVYLCVRACVYMCV